MSYILLFIALWGISASAKQNLNRNTIRNDLLSKDSEANLFDKAHVGSVDTINNDNSGKTTVNCDKSAILVKLYYHAGSYAGQIDNKIRNDMNYEPFSFFIGRMRIDLSELFKSRVLNGSQSVALCLNEGIYEIRKNEERKPNEKFGIVKVEMNDKIVSTINMNELESNKSVKVKIDKEIQNHFNARQLLSYYVLPEYNEWGYSAIPQSDNSWSNIVNDWITYTPSSFPAKTTTTTYYRTKFTLPDIAATNGPILKVKYSDGLIVYVNGIEIFRKNMPLGEINSEIKATKSFESLTESTISIPQSIIRSFDNFIGIEIHKSESSPLSQNDEFSATIETVDRGLQTQISADNVDITIRSQAGNIPVEIKDMGNMYDVNTGYISVVLDREGADKWFPLNFNFTFKNHVAKYVNQFRISGCSNNAGTHPRDVKIYGSVDSENIEWILLFENADLGLSGVDCSGISTFALNPINKAFEIFRFEVISNRGYGTRPTDWGHYIQMKLFVFDEKPLSICEANENYPSTNIGMTSISYCGSGYKEVTCGNDGNFETEVDHECNNDLIKSEWQYTDSTPSSPHWNNEYIEGESEWMKISLPFPDFTSSIRYYRNYFTINDILVSGSPKLKITYKDGLKIYINGNEIFRRNFNGDVIIPFETATEETILIPLPVLLNGRNIIGIEIHKSDSSVSDPLIISLEYMKLTINTVTTLDTVNVNEIGLISEKGNAPVDYSNLDKTFAMASESTNDNPDYCGITLVKGEKANYMPFYITYKFNGYNAFYFNEFKISGCSNNWNNRPKNIKILGATDKDHPEWEELYSNTDLGLKGGDGTEHCTEVKTFSLLNVRKSYESYRLEVVDIAAYDVNPFAHYIQYRLFILNSISLPVCYAYDGFDKAFAGTNGTASCGNGSKAFKIRKCLENGLWDEVIDDSMCSVITEQPTTPATTTVNPTSQTPSTPEPTTVKPTTQEPTTVKPTTETPTTVNPSTQTPTTVKPTTQTPTTVKPTTSEPTTQTPTPTTQIPTQTPTTIEPTTQTPTTVKPTTQTPTTIEPTTPLPTTVKPTTPLPTTVKPTTQTPTAVKPTTSEPTTVKPTTQTPTTQTPTTVKPSTPTPTTPELTTQSPTTELPTTDSPTDSTIYETGTVESTDETSVPTTSIPTTPKPIERISIEIKVSNVTGSELSENDKNIIKDSIIEVYQEKNVTLVREDIEVVVNNRNVLLRGLENEMNIEVIVTIPEESTKTEILEIANELKEDSSRLSEEIKSKAESSSEDSIFKEFEIEITNVVDKTIYPTNSAGKSDSSDGLSTGVLIGIIAGGVVIVLIVIVGIVLCRSRKSESHSSKTKSKPKPNVNPISTQPVVEKGVKPSGKSEIGANIEMPKVTVVEEKKEEIKPKEEVKHEEVKQKKTKKQKKAKKEEEKSKEEEKLKDVEVMKEEERKKEDIPKVEEKLTEEVKKVNEENPKEEEKKEEEVIPTAEEKPADEKKEEEKKEEEDKPTIEKPKEEVKPKEEEKKEVKPHPRKTGSKTNRKRSGSGSSYSSSYSGSSSSGSDSEN